VFLAKNNQKPHLKKEKKRKETFDFVRQVDIRICTANVSGRTKKTFECVIWF
jgi:hypothetical protein